MAFEISAVCCCVISIAPNKLSDYTGIFLNTAVAPRRVNNNFVKDFTGLRKSRAANALTSDFDFCCPFWIVFVHSAGFA
jgi:hypothetical protein